jgi:translation initiation factor IF-1
MTKDRNFRKQTRDDRVEIQGVVVEAFRGMTFEVKINNTETTVLAQLSGKLRQNNIRVLPGDKVTVEVSPFDMTRGRIIWRS